MRAETRTQIALFYLSQEHVWQMAQIFAALSLCIAMSDWLWKNHKYIDLGVTHKF